MIKRYTNLRILYYTVTTTTTSIPSGILIYGQLHSVRRDSHTPIGMLYKVKECNAIQFFTFYIALVIKTK